MPFSGEASWAVAADGRPTAVHRRGDGGAPLAHGHWKTTTLVAAAALADGAMDGETS